MHKLVNSIIILFIFCCISCSKQKGTPPLSDEEFLETISNQDFRASIQQIDSLIKTGKQSSHRKAILLYEKGRLLANLEKDIEAIGSFNEALFLFNQDSDKKLLAKTNMLLGDSYAILSKQDTASFYINSAYKLYKEISNKRGEARTLNSLGHLSFLKGDFLTSANNVKKAIAIQLTLDDNETIAASYNNLGFILEQTEDYDQAILYYKKAILLNNEASILDSNPIRNLGAVYLIKNDINKCISLYKEALIIEEQTEQYSIQKEIYDVLIEASIKDKKIDEVSQFISKKDSISRLLNAYENKERTKLVNTKYKQLVTQENLKRELELNKKNKIILASVLGLFLLFGLFLYQKNRNSRLELKQEKLVLEQKMLRIQMNPHFIFNTLTAIQKKVFDNEPLEQMTYISKFAKLIRQNFDFVNKEEITLAEDLDALINYIETQQFRFNNKFDYTIQIDENIDPTNVNIPPMLLQIFVENAIEHGLKPKTKEGKLVININRENEFIKFDIIDNGIGYKEKETPEEHATDIFKKRLTLRRLGEEKLFSIKSLGTNLGTKVTFLLNLK